MSVLSASFATTASYVLNAVSASFATSSSFAVSASWAPSTNIYTADGTLSADRTVTSNGFGLTILGGKEFVSTIQTALELKTSASNKIINLRLTNTHPTTGKTYAISSEIDGTFRIGDTTTTSFLRNSTGQIAIGNTAVAGNANTTILGYTNNLGILKITGAGGTIDGNGLELFFTGNTSYALSFDRSGNIWRDFELQTLNTKFRNNASYTGQIFSSTGNWLIQTGGTYTDAGFKLDVLGTTRFTGNSIVSGSLSVSNSTFINQNTSSLGSGTQVISTNATSSFTSAFYNYTVSSGSNARAGQVMAIWNGASINFTEVSTLDIGTTAAVTLTASLSGGNVLLSTSLPTAGWNVKTIINLL
jgi:hypothetical protein